MSSQKREHFRIIYPKSYMAKLEVRGKSYDIQNISQHGVKIEIAAAGNAKDFCVNEQYGGIVVLCCAQRVVVEGKVLRNDKGTVVLYLVEAIPLKAMYDEHRLLIQKFTDQVSPAEE